MDMLEREMGYKEELFDFIQQFLRTILLKREIPYCQTNDRRRFTALPISWSSSISFINALITLPAIFPATHHSSKSILRTPQTQCCRSRPCVRSQWMGLM